MPYKRKELNPGSFPVVYIINEEEKWGEMQMTQAVKATVTTFRNKGAKSVIFTTPVKGYFH